MASLVIKASVISNILFFILITCRSASARHAGICTGPNEIFACGSACQTECATLGQRCPIINKKCNDKCYCIEGYARDKNNICIPINQCPQKAQHILTIH